MRDCIHFVGFRGEEYWSAIKAFGKPDFIHRGWDMRAQREIADDDVVVFATGNEHLDPSRYNYNDLQE